jgi:hypothetical protein
MAAFALAGCKSMPPPPARVTVVTSPKATKFDSMTDEQLVHANQTDGLGLGLKIAGLDDNKFPSGAPLPLHLVMEDLGARQPIASGMCSGFQLTATDVNTQDSQTNDITNPHCFGTVPYPDEVPFAKGKLKAVDLSQRNASNMTLAPGTYSLVVTWHALAAGKGTILDRPAYTTVISNAVQVTVTQ